MKRSVLAPRFVRGCALLSAVVIAPVFATAAVVETDDGPVEITEMVGGLTEPWGIAFLPDGSQLITERDGRLLHATVDGPTVEVTGVPEVWAEGQGGLLDVMVPADFAETREVFLTYSKPQDGGEAGTALASARLSDNGTALEGLADLFVMTPGGSRGQHFGSRVVEGPDAHLFVTIGERGNRDLAQDLTVHNGTTIRLNRDGSVPEDNPFVGQEGAQPEIWSYGHRNAQGADIDAEGRFWVVEHGAQGGDEVNLVEPGVNFGWPVISYGQNYNGTPIGEGQTKEGMAQPAHYWDPSIAPSGMAFHSGTAFPDWEGHALVGSLKFNYIAVLDPSDWSEVQIESDETLRVRDVAEAPDGSVWFLSVGNGAAYRMTPTE
ncbi:PQQ-dependent sugar dehydrogenase [Maritimibacter sp. DP1N21-5]|uniref:PQQ-dependent sugar dehydrogenase n=1 Tax=Maritimibacter sp. DP1N21-5 TaxID=2836867 RepID=UPI001C47DC0D|nr:PQQ-dependent sugar dehydrogenase [Maritimibacter sp. DP1N21-5]MBV7409931.1 PQQ-dependent sugar dehydrogenase [Maritimibacter sp. DP1N21-5]